MDNEQTMSGDVKKEVTPRLESAEQAIKKKKKKKKDRNGKEGIGSLEKFDARGIQTLFRTLSRNHYNLLRMIDNKASIILTINSIITSLLMGAMFIAPESDRSILEISSKMMIVFSIFSMIFALISMLPHKYLGKIYRGSGYRGSLYAANFAQQSLEEFQLEFGRIMTNGQSIYDEMVKDLYFLGRTIHGKQIMLMISFAFFITGLIISIVYNISSGLRLFG